MERQTPNIWEVVKKVRGSDGQEFAAVRCQDGRYGITCGGHLVETLRWDAHQLDDCVRFLEHFARAQ